MKEIRTIIPEDCFDVNETITMEDIENAFKTQTTITGRVLEYYSYVKIVVVDLGNGIIAQMPFDEVCLDRLEKVDDPIQVRDISLKKIIRVKVIDIKDSREIIVSRKRNLEQCYIQNQNPNISCYVRARVINVSRKCVFFDIGEGLVAVCNACEISKVHVQHPKQWIKKGEWRNVKIKSFNENLTWCSIKDGYPADYSKIKAREIIKVRLGEPIYSQEKELTGFFVEITPAIAGIADVLKNVDYSNYKTGENVNCYVRSYKPREKKVKLWLQ